MDEIDRRMLDDLKSELVLRKREKQHLSEKLDCLILLIKRAWQGDKDAISHVSQIVGIPPPSILPQIEEPQESGETGQEYLNLTSEMLDEQLAVDKDIKKVTKVLRPASAKRMGATRRVKSAHVLSRTTPTSKETAQLSPFKNGSSTRNESRAHYDPLSPSNKERPIVHLPLSDLHDIIPMFSTPKSDGMAIPKISDINEKNHIFEEKESNILFDPEGIVGGKKTRPISAALQRRQDFMRSQGKKKTRPHSAMPNDKPAFRHSTDSEYETLVHTHHGMPSPENLNMQPNPSPRSKENSPPNISINISQKRQGKKLRHHQSNFPHARDDQAFGDVADALQRVQEMERMFRLNTKRLQKKIGIPAEGCI